MRLTRIALLLFLSACASPGDDDAGSEVEAVALRQALTIDAEFGEVQGLAVDASGRIYVADAMTHAIRVFSPAGEPLGSVGRRGRGPGEFTRLQDVVVARGDSLFALDIALQRVTAYSLGDLPSLAYTTDVSSRSGGSASYSLLVPASGGFVVQYTTPFASENLDARREIVLRRVDGRGGVVTDSLLVVPDRESLVTRSPQYGYSVGSMPFGRRPVLRLGGDDRLYYGWSDSLAVGIYSLDGERVDRVGGEHPAHRVTQPDLDALLGSFSTDFSRQLLRGAIDGGRVPTTKPAFKDFLVDDRGRVWVNVVTGDDTQVSSDQGLRYVSRNGEGGDGGDSPWWVFDRDGKRVAEVSLPHGVALHVVRGTEAYGIETDSLGVQRVVRYRIGD